MKKNKYQLIDEGSYYRAFQQWLDASADVYNLRNESQMNEKWLKFADDVGVFLGLKKSENLLAEVVDNTCWKEAKKYYSIISYDTEVEPELS